jgi:hypothetical protein
METLELAPNEKRCSKCKEIKDRGEFGLNNKTLDKLHYSCRICVAAAQRRIYQNLVSNMTDEERRVKRIFERRKEKVYRERNREKLRAKSKRYSENNKEKIKEYKKAYKKRYNAWLKESS